MSDHLTKSLDELAADILEDGIIDAAEVLQIRERIYEDDTIDKEEADFLFKLNDGVSGKDNDSSWKELFIEAISDYVLKDETSPGVIDEEEASYLISKIQADGVVDNTELELLLHITTTAKECHDSFNDFVLISLKDVILEDGIIDDSEVDMIKSVVYGTGGGGGEGVDRAEADFLFDLNDATSGKQNCNNWKTFFVEAISKHVLEDEESPGVIDEDEATWLINRIEGDNTYDDNEKALLANIKENAKDIHQNLTFVFDKLKI